MSVYVCPRCGAGFGSGEVGPTPCGDCGQLVDLPRKTDAVAPAERHFVRWGVRNSDPNLDRNFAIALALSIPAFCLFILVREWFRSW